MSNILKTIQTRFDLEKYEYKKELLAEYINALDTMGTLPDMSEKELYVFLKYCFSLGLNPLYNEIYCVPFKKNGKVVNQPVIAYQEYIKRASRHPSYQLPETKVILTDENGKQLPKDLIHVVVTVKRKGDDSIFQKVYFMSEWNRNTPIWQKQPIDMLQTRALKNALAICYPEQVSSLEQMERSAEVEIIDLEKEETKKKQMKELMGSNEY